MDTTLACSPATISALAPEPSGDRLALAHWDGILAVYDCPQMPSTAPSSSTVLEPTFRFEHPGPLLAVCWGPPGSGIVFTGGADRKVRSWDLAKNDGRELGEMEGPISSLVYSSSQDLLIAGSFVPSLLLISSPRSPTPPPGRLLVLPAKPLALTLTPERIVVAMAERLVYVWRLEGLKGGRQGWEEPEQKRESALKGVTRAVEGMKDGLGWAACSVDGRIAVEYFAPSDQAKKYAYKAHRLASKTDGDAVFAINALSYHPSQRLFVSAGSDGSVCLWDPEAKKRVKSWKFAGGVGVCAFEGRGEGRWLAVGWGALEQEGKPGQAGDVGCVLKWVG